MTLELAAAKDRDLSSEELKSMWQELAGEIPGVVSLAFRAETAAGGNAIDINLTGPDNEQLVAAATWATERLRNDYKGVVDVSNSDRRGREELIVRDLTPRRQGPRFRSEHGDESGARRLLRQRSAATAAGP